MELAFHTPIGAFRCDIPLHLAGTDVGCANGSLDGPGPFKSLEFSLEPQVRVLWRRNRVVAADVIY
jgi:hypothetical protein